jgi:uncharacterized membrane protein YidH (DUF202 family)
LTDQRRWGYFVWIVAALVIGIPEIIAAFSAGLLPFTTISTMTGHLERQHTWVELVVVAAIVFFVFSTVRLRPRETSGRKPDDPPPGSGEPTRTPGGRLTLQPEDPDQTAAEFDRSTAPTIFAICAAISLVAIALATWAATRWWDDKHHYQPAYVLYGSLFLLWIVIPSIVAFALGKDTPFPTLFRTIDNLEDWLRSRMWPGNLGPIAGWLVAYTIFAGLVILLLHLTLYPYPDITKVLNPNG